MDKNKLIKGKRFGEERALYGEIGSLIEECRFQGAEDGESAMKECRDITVKNCYMDLRYPLWHAVGLKVIGGEMTENCRAALWYDVNAEIDGALLNGIKAVRECRNVDVKNCRIVSPEFGWQSNNISLKDTDIESEYAFLHTDGISLDRVNLKGKYTFQYTNNVTVRDSRLDTKDAFWHAKDVTVYDSEVIGEYLGWYSENLTFVRCHIKGTQPLCYCKNLKLIDCTSEECDLAFEYSDVQAEIRGHIDSVKNPRFGSITADSIGETILTDDSLFKCECKVSER